MIKADFVASVAEKAGMTKTDAKFVIDTVFECLKEGLQKEGDKYTQLGFGTFKVDKRKARTAKNPQTGKTIKVKAKKVVKFKASKNIIK